MVYYFTLRSLCITKLNAERLLLLIIKSDQTPKKFNFSLVSIFPVPHWSLQDQRNISEVRTVDNSPESLQPDGSLSNVLMSVPVTAHWSHAVVEMTSHQPLPAHELLKLTEKSVEACLGAEVVASCHGVAGVKTDPNPGLVLHQLDDRLQLPEISANGVALRDEVSER